MEQWFEDALDRTSDASKWAKERGIPVLPSVLTSMGLFLVIIFGVSSLLRENIDIVVGRVTGSGK